MPNDEKSIEDMQEDYDANARIRGEWLEKGREETYLRNLLSKQKTTKAKMTHADFLQKMRERQTTKPKTTNPNRPVKRDYLHKSECQARQEKKVDDTEVWKREVREEFDKKLVAERNAKFGKPEDFKSKTQWEKHIRSKIKALVDEREERKKEMHSKPVFEKSPQEMYIKAIEQIDCECEADSTCDTCKLFKKVWEYTLQLFKDAAGGRISYV